MLQKISLPNQTSDPWCLFTDLSEYFAEGFFLDAWGENKITYMGFSPTKSISRKIKSPDEPVLQEDLHSYIREAQTSLSSPEKFPFEGGVISLLGYNCGAEFESFPNRKIHQDAREDYYLALYETVIVFDPKTAEFYLAGKASDQITHAIQNLNSLDKSKRLMLSQPSQASQNRTDAKHFKTKSEPRSQVGEENYSKWVEDTVEYIGAGDIFQANLAHPLQFEYDGSPFELYKRVRDYNPSPYGGVVYKEDLFLLSNSPELLFSHQAGRIVTRPIAGTRPRSEQHDEDMANKEELFLSEKEQAEHIMLVDLERNDLGRVSKMGSVHVEELMVCEAYQNVYHIVSQVVGELREEFDTVDIIKALFPGGTITGAPKIRSMEIIDEMETNDRQFYTGSLGWIGPQGHAEFNILIRSLILTPTTQNQGIGRLQVGAGIVADSQSSKEWQETLAKAAAWMKFLR